MKTAAIIVNGVVVNKVILPDDWEGKPRQWQPPAGTLAILSDVASIGDSFDGTKFIKPPPPSPGPPDPRRVNLEARIDALAVIPDLKAILKELIG